MKLTESRLRSIVREEIRVLTEAEGVYKDNVRSSAGLDLAHAIEREFGRGWRDIDGIKIKSVSKRYKTVTVYGQELAQKVQQIADREGIRLDLEEPDYSDAEPLEPHYKGVDGPVV